VKLLQSVAGFTKVGLHGIRFCESLDKHVYVFFICICEYTIVESVVAANKSIWANYDVASILNGIRKNFNKNL